MGKKEVEQILARSRMTYSSGLTWRAHPPMEPGMHKPIPVMGYKPQSGDTIVIVNRFKKEEERVLRLLDEMSLANAIDQRWLAIGRTQLEQAFMAINRSVFKPGRVELPVDDDAVGQEIADEEARDDVLRDEMFAEVGDEDPEEPLTAEEEEAFDHALRKDD